MIPLKCIYPCANKETREDYLKPEAVFENDRQDGGLRQVGSRVFYMDSLRAVLMSLGVALHAAQVYDTSRQWVVADPSGSPAYAMVITLIHLYRMPVFFLVAGFFSYLAFTKYSAAEFIRTRFVRIALPFLATLLTVNAAQQWYFAENGLRNFTIVHWVGQLWFLAYLFLYVILFIAVMARSDLLRLPIAVIERVCASKLAWVGLYVLFMGVFAAIRLLIKMFNLWDTTILGFIDVPQFLEYLVYFVAGLIIYRSQPVYEVVTQPGRIVPLLAFALAVVVLGAKHFAAFSGVAGLLSTVAELSATFFGAMLIIGIFKRYFNFNSRMSRFFSEASYSIYLFHGPFLIAFAIILLPVNMPAIGKFLLLVTMCLTCTLALHALVISRVPILMLLFNGKGVTRRHKRITDQFL